MGPKGKGPGTQKAKEPKGPKGPRAQKGPLAGSQFGAQLVGYYVAAFKNKRSADPEGVTGV